MNKVDGRIVWECTTYLAECGSDWPGNCRTIRYGKRICGTVSGVCWTMGTILSLASPSVLATPPQDCFL